MLFAVSTFMVLSPIAISGQTVQQLQHQEIANYPGKGFAAHVLIQPEARVSGMTPRRLVASIAAVVALIGMGIGGLALVRPAGRFGTASGRLGAIVALASGLIGIAFGGLMIATAPGGLGSGGGLAGAVVALVVGLIAMALGGLSLARSRSTV